MNSSDGVRHRHSSQTASPQTGTAVEILKTLDVFPKIEEDYQKYSSSGGFISISIFVFIAILMIYESISFLNSELIYEYSLDRDFSLKVPLNIDIVIPMACDLLGPDVLDAAGGHVHTLNVLSEQPTIFKLSPSQEKWQKKRLNYRNSALDSLYTSLNDILHAESIFATPMPKLEEKDITGQKYQSCRIFGSIPVNKVIGNFHITVGKTIEHPLGHAHLSAFIPKSVYNFSHRIDALSFGGRSSMMNSLEGELFISKDHQMLIQYFIKVVPTVLKTQKHKSTLTYQYSVTRNVRNIATESRGGSTISGIFFRYDFDPVVVTIREKEKYFLHFLTRLCGVIGGIFATSGIIHSVIDTFMTVVKNRINEY